MTMQATNRYKESFAHLKEQGKKAFIPFTVLGYPNVDVCFASIKLMIDCGASALELGIAFSDPVADGPIIQGASFHTLDAGFTVKDAMSLIKRVREYAPKLPIGILTYYNIILARGIEQFFELCANSGVDSVLIADLNPDCADEIVPACTKYGIAPVFIISPLTDHNRLQAISQLSHAYIYVVSRLGITGTEERSDDNLEALLQRARACSDVPLCVGFGVSSPKQAASMIAMGADGVITGSKIVELVKTDPSLKTLDGYLREMVMAAATAPAANS